MNSNKLKQILLNCMSFLFCMKFHFNEESFQQHQQPDVELGIITDDEEFEDIGYEISDD